MVPDIEVGAGAAFARPDDIADKADAAADAGIALRVGEERDVVNGVRPRVVEVELQPMREVLRQCDQQTVVGREAIVGEERVLRELCRHTYILSA